MKNIFTLFLFFILMNAGAQVPGQKLVPKAVLDQFAVDFPGITPKRWEAKIGKQFEAVMIHNNKPSRARYDANGRHLFTTYHWTGNTCPDAAKNAILATFSGFKVDWANEVINLEKGTDRFLIHLSKPGHILKVFVNADGSVVTDGKEEEFNDAGNN